MYLNVYYHILICFADNFRFYSGMATQGVEDQNLCRTETEVVAEKEVRR